MKLTRTVTLSALIAALTLTSVGCAATNAAEPSTTSDDTKSIRIGFNPGPYKQMFEEGVAHALESEGYDVELLDFTDGIVVNVAVARNEIDANIMQHPTYLNFVNAQEGLDNAPLVQIPTPSMALFGGKKTAIDQVQKGSTITVPNSPSNLYRGLLILRDIGWVDFEDVADPNTADLSIITSNPHDLKITAIDNAQQVPALQDVDFAAIQGNFVIAGGLDYGEALAVEDQPLAFSNVVTVRAADLDSEWAKALRDAYQSEEFGAYLADNPLYVGYNLPEWYK